MMLALSNPGLVFGIVLVAVFVTECVAVVVRSIASAVPSQVLLFVLPVALRLSAMAYFGLRLVAILDRLQHTVFPIPTLPL